MKLDCGNIRLEIVSYIKIALLKIHIIFKNKVIQNTYHLYSMPFIDQLIVNRRKPNDERRVIFIIKK